MTKKSVKKFLEDVKKDSALQDIRRGLSQGKPKVGIVNYLTEEANQRGYEFTAIELEEELLPWLLSAQSELLETPQESLEDSGEKPEAIQEPIEEPEATQEPIEEPEATQEPIEEPKSTQEPIEEPKSIQEPIEKPESRKKSTQKLGKMSTKSSAKTSTKASTKAPTETPTETPTEASTDTPIKASDKISADTPTTSSTTSEMLSALTLSKPTQSLQEARKIKINALEKVLKSKLSNLKGRIWA
jgi:outer membrane biosynthesis protein TonB